MANVLEEIAILFSIYFLEIVGGILLALFIVVSAVCIFLSWLAEGENAGCGCGCLIFINVIAIGVFLYLLFS